MFMFYLYWEWSLPIEYKLHIFFHILFKAMFLVLRIMTNTQCILKTYLLKIKGSYFIQNCLRCSTSLACPYEFQNFAYVYKSVCWDFDRNCVQPLHQFGENWHHYCIEFSNPWRWYMFPFYLDLVFLSPALSGQQSRWPLLPPEPSLKSRWWEWWSSS